jgi:hypothetical protein
VLDLNAAFWLAKRISVPFMFDVLLSRINRSGMLNQLSVCNTYGLNREQENLSGYFNGL